MIDAVLFDWNNTLVSLEWDDDLVEIGHRAGLGRDDSAFTARWRETMLDGSGGERPYADILRDLGVAEPDAFIDAEHEVWRPAHSVLASAQALLDSLRARGIKTGLVANSWPDPGRVLRKDAELFGLADRLDVLVYSAEVGVRKPDPEIFLHACRELEVEAAATMYVGDNLVTDVQGAADVGMTTVQALWFRADDTPGIEADFMAFTSMDVLNAVLRLAR
ncbi:MAG TPA: HAD-IA family hydrolase [Gaiellaceae bacterium]|nr:HAD-IA family hydrolase [Gaiellaceae bacterium]